ncbi:hypothetical protein HELRODRAFT_179416 [Helobdella robusta]|uniref:GPN-loop GTPase 3 n=1 Tax=Helobdella robusta TaxID=6412 RepID=T1FEN9_HELRO|nr:hypothetical protein HELRODRAFT_179416 [Helobdella robusta]ESN95348.1 hypothetical protein HELRODRAFT_179416 [Helobdella robusta]
MSRYCQLVIGPAGSGKSTYCDAIQKYGQAVGRTIDVVNLDPAAEYFSYDALADIKDLISIDDVMECDDLKLGPNGGLMFCMEHLSENFHWLRDSLGEVEDDYILFDCPGQIELYTHSPVMKLLVEELKNWNFRVCSVFLLDSQFLVDPFKYVSGMMCALSAMVNLEVASVNVLSKIDLLDKKSKKEIESFLSSSAKDFLLNSSKDSIAGKKFQKLTSTIASVVDNFSLVQYVPLNIKEEKSIDDLLIFIDNSIQYGEDIEHKENRAEDFEGDEMNRSLG